MTPAAPAVYRIRPGVRIFAAVLIAVAVFVFFSVCSEARLHTIGSPRQSIAIASLVLVCAVLFALYAFTSSIRPTAEAVEHRSYLGSVSIRFNHIRGRRELVARGDDGVARHFIIVSDANPPRKIKFAHYHAFDDSFYDWFLSLPDLDVDKQ